VNAVEIIIKKREKRELSEEEIRFFVHGITSGEIPDYQISAWAMAVLLNGMTARETTELTIAMAHSGEVLDLSNVVKLAMDKHSSGGVGDKTTLVVLPIVVACGLPVGKMSGHGLGFSGGTLDKMESIPGYRVNLSTEEFTHQLGTIGIVLAGQSIDLAPADGKLYALRDVTGTVQSIPLIASSIMSKKIAAGAHAIVLDIKVGLGAFMSTLGEARKLARLMVDIGKLAGREVVTLLSDMNQPLGNAVGNSLEVIEAIETLHNHAPQDFLEHCVHVSATMLVLGNRASNIQQGSRMAITAIDNGEAFEKFRVLVSAQGGDVSYVDDPEKFPKAKYSNKVIASHSGALSQIHARVVGEAAVGLGAGRLRKGEPIDHEVGIIVHHKVGDKVMKGDPLFTVYANDLIKLNEASNNLESAIRWSRKSVTPLPLFYE
jgi:pyrimidine-nucleoside phosphorylase